MRNGFDEEAKVRNVYSGFRLDKFEKDMRSEKKKDDTDKKYVIEFMDGIPSEFDILAGDYLAQYANEKKPRPSHGMLLPRGYTT